MSTTIGNLRSIVASYMHRTTVDDLNTAGVSGPPLFDIGLYGFNAARRKAERLADFKYAEADANLSIAAGGTLITAATGLPANSTIKRVNSVTLAVADGNIPIEFLTNDEWLDRIRRQIGRVAYNPAATLASLGFSEINPIAYQQAQTIVLLPAAQFIYPVATVINVVRFMPDYTADASTDFFCQWAPEYLQWECCLEVNKFFRRFSPKQEGNIDEVEVKAMADEALQSLLAWNSSMNIGTSTPPGAEAPQGKG